MPRYSYGLSSFVLDSPFRNESCALFESVAEWGFDVVEVCIEDPALLDASIVREAAARAGLAVAVCGAFGPERDISSPDPARAALAYDYLVNCIDFACAVGADQVAGPMYAPTGRARLLTPDGRRAEWQRAADGLRKVSDYAAPRGVRLAIEPLNRFETDLVNTVEQGLRLCADIDRDNVGLLVDTFHMNIEERSYTEAVAAAAAANRLFHVQLAENDRGTPGAGHVPWQEFFAALDAAGYQGQVVIESFLPDIKEIARAVSLWRDVAPSMESLAREGLRFVKGATA